MRIEQALARLQEAADLGAARGSLLYHLDLATEVARIAFAAAGVIAEVLVPVVDANGYRVLAMDAAAQSPLVQARFAPTGEPVILPADHISPRVPALAAAWKTIRLSLEDGGRNYAVIVIPANDPLQRIEGYALAVDAAPDVFRVTGHELLTLARSGSQIIARTPLAVTTTSDQHDRRGQHHAVMISEDAVPNEVHTYLSLRHNVPLTVTMSGSNMTWRVDGEHTFAK